MQENLPGVYLAQLIDVEAWSRPRWGGVVYMTDPSAHSLPALGILFDDEQAAGPAWEPLTLIPPGR